MSDFLFRGDIEELDSVTAELIRHETARQQQKLIMIPSESTAPYAVRHALSSPFHNIYAEGYPSEHTRQMAQAGYPRLWTTAARVSALWRPALLQGHRIRQYHRGRWRGGGRPRFLPTMG